MNNSNQTIFVFLPKSPYENGYQVNKNIVMAQNNAGKWAETNCDQAKVILQEEPISDPGHSHVIRNISKEPMFRHYGVVVIVGYADAVSFKLLFGEYFEESK